MRTGEEASTVLWVAGMVLGGLALAVRPPSPVGSLAVTVGVGLFGWLAPVPPPAAASAGDRGRWLTATGLGIAAFVVARAIRHPAPSPAWFAVVAVISAVGEEVFFRRLLYGWLAISGPVLAIG